MTDYEKINKRQVHSERDRFTISRYNQFYRNFPKGHVISVCDVGCNTGRGGEVLKNLQPDLQIVGLDCVSDRIAALPKGVYDRSICSYSNSINSEDEAFDVIVAGEFIEHLTPDDVITTLGEFYRVIKRGGRLMMTTPNPNYIRLKLTGGKVMGGGCHLSEHYPKVLKSKVEKAGFSDVRVKGSGKITWFLGDHIPFLPFYGSFLTIADKL